MLRKAVAPAEQVGLLLQFGKHLGDALLQLFSGLELNYCSSRDGDCRFRLVGIASDFRFGLRHLERPEISENNVIVAGEARGHFFNEALDDACYFLLGETGLIADPDYEVTFSNGGHGSFVVDFGSLISDCSEAWQ